MNPSAREAQQSVPRVKIASPEIDRSAHRLPNCSESPIPNLCLARWLVFAACLGMLVRLALAAFSEGTNDVGSWARFATEIANSGLYSTYRADPRFNHPPLIGYWAWSALRISQSTGIRFSFIFKLPVIAADCGTVLLLWRIYRRAGPLISLSSMALYAWSVDAILVSGYHCNTDPIYAFACLLAVWLIEEKDPPFPGRRGVGCGH